MVSGIHGDMQNSRDKGLPPVQVPPYWKDSPILPPAMRHDAGHGGSAIFISAEFINALLEDREPEIDLYESRLTTDRSRGRQTVGEVADRSPIS